MVKKKNNVNIKLSFDDDKDPGEKVFGWPELFAWIKKKIRKK